MEVLRIGVGVKRQWCGAGGGWRRGEKKVLVTGAELDNR